MSPRAYRLGRRRETIAETRERVLVAARDEFGESGFFTTTLEAVATRAGVARATVYYQFKSKHALLDATIAHVVEHANRRDELRRALEEPDATKALRDYVGAACQFWDEHYHFYRSVIGLAAVDAEAGRIADEYDRRRREPLVWLAKRLADQEQLRSGVTQKDAVNVIWLMTSFRSYDHLHGRSALSLRAASALLTDLTCGILAD
jgi:AcrR family transcriptional regulator